MSVGCHRQRRPWANALIASVLSCGVLSAGACAHTTSTIERPATTIAEAVVTGERYPDVGVEFLGGVSGLPDQVYAVMPGYRPLTLDLYLPAARARGERYPLVLFVHGGAWQGGNARHAGAIEDFPSFLAQLAAEGYVVASINYRLSGEAAFPAPVMDAKLALRWLRSRSAELNLDPARAVAWGVSAGGQIAGLLALACDSSELDLARNGALAAAGAESLAGFSDCVQGLVLWYAPSAFAAAGPDTPEARYLGCSQACAPDLLRRASPISFADADDPPTLLIHGRADEVVPFWHAEELDQRLREVGARTQLLAIDHVGHSFIGRNHDETRAATLHALDRTGSFIASVLAHDRDARATRSCGAGESGCR